MYNNVIFFGEKIAKILEIKNLCVSVEGRQILKGIDLSVEQGEVHAIMGPNGSGKSTLSNAIMGHPKFAIDSGKIFFEGEEISSLPSFKRAKKGLFLAFQYPLEVQGVSLFNFLRAAYNSLKSNGNETIPITDFQNLVKEKLKLLGMDESFIKRYLNDGFSGGEKKRCEILQMAVLQPKIAILDETDSGLDIDSLKIVASGINSIASREMGIILITHYQRILKYVKPDFVHVMIDGRIVKSGKGDLATELEKNGYSSFTNGDSS